MTVTINRYRWANQNSLLLHCDGVDGSTTIADATVFPTSVEIPVMKYFFCIKKLFYSRYK